INSSLNFGTTPCDSIPGGQLIHHYGSALSVCTSSNSATSAETREARAFFSCLAHDLKGQFNQWDNRGQSTDWPISSRNPSEWRARMTRHFITWNSGACSRKIFTREMLAAMPDATDYRAMSGKSKMGSVRPDGKPTRTKIDLFPEYIRHLPQEKRAVWEVAGGALRSGGLQKAFIERLAPGLERRFGADYAKVAMYPVPILTRDIPGYRIYKH